jgi:lipopolysaccharide/colanic/teichoic acid biosynthesis glycosyltransferase
MNNSELSGVSSSAEVFAESRTCVYPRYWAEVTADEPLPSDTEFQDRRSPDGGDEAEHPGTAVVDEAQGIEVAESGSSVEVDRPDWGLWLLRGSVVRHDHWEHLGDTLQSSGKANEQCSSRLSGVIKRICDVAGSCCLLILLFPLFLLVAVLIKLDSRGPVFFRHDRVGKDGKNFVLWKFRSMRTEVAKYEVSPRSAADARLTRVGRLIRRLSMDEMPQLINVLRGEMSLVGPRPEMPFIVHRFHPAECRRTVTKPGITGLWQISPARAFPIHDNLHYDLHYVRNQNLLLDCAIIVRTIAAVIRGIGAV